VIYLSIPHLALPVIPLSVLLFLALVTNCPGSFPAAEHYDLFFSPAFDALEGIGGAEDTAVVFFTHWRLLAVDRHHHGRYTQSRQKPRRLTGQITG